MQHWQRKTGFGVAVDQLADDVATLVAEEQTGEHLHLKVGQQLGLAQLPGHHRQHAAGIALQVFKRDPQVEVLHHAHQLRLHVVHRGVVAAVGGLVAGARRIEVFDVLGTDRGPHKNEIVLEVTAVQDFGGHRVEKRLGQFRLMVIHQQADVVELDLLPHLGALLAGLELAL